MEKRDECGRTGEQANGNGKYQEDNNRGEEGDGMGWMNVLSKKKGVQGRKASRLVANNTTPGIQQDGWTGINTRKVEECNVNNLRPGVAAVLY